MTPGNLRRILAGFISLAVMLCFCVVCRSGGATVYGSAYTTPALRSALHDLIKDPPAATK